MPTDRREMIGPPRRGFTLLEVMIALAFVALALVAAIRTQGQGVVLTGQARFTTRAVFLAKSLLTEAETRTDIAPGVVDGRFEQPNDDLGWQRVVSPAPGAPGLFRVRIRVHPLDRPPEEGLSLEGFLYRGEP